MPPFAWPFRTSMPVRFRDLDAMGHVNNVVYLTYFEQARTDCYLALCDRTDPIERGAGLDFVVARAEIDYVAPVRYGETIVISVRPESVGHRSFTLAYEASLRGSASCVARGRTVLVAYDFEARVSRPVPDELAALLRAGLAKPEGGR